MAKSYNKKLLDPRWQKLRLEVFKRDEWTCQICAAKDKTLNAHHCHYTNHSEGPWDYNAESLITLCQDCHENEHLIWPEYKDELLQSVVLAGFKTAEQWSELAFILDRMSDAKKSDELKHEFADWLVNNYWKR